MVTCLRPYDQAAEAKLNKLTTCRVIMHEAKTRLGFPPENGVCGGRAEPAECGGGPK